jgi:hypothetical protein
MVVLVAAVKPDRLPEKTSADTDPDFVFHFHPPFQDFTPSTLIASQKAHQAFGILHITSKVVDIFLMSPNGLDMDNDSPPLKRGARGDLVVVGSLQIPLSPP